MSYEKKYLKYKSKYLALKNFNQVGGSKFSEMNELTTTPTHMEVYGYEPKTSFFENKKNIDIKRLTKLLEDSDVHESEHSELKGMSEEETEESEQTGGSEESEETSKSEETGGSEESEETSKSEQTGGANKYDEKTKKLNRKHFFDDSDLSSSTESLSSMDSSDSEL